jgi:hypothetical protein
MRALYSKAFRPSMRRPMPPLTIGFTVRACQTPVFQLTFMREATLVTSLFIGQSSCTIAVPDENRRSTRGFE